MNSNPITDALRRDTSRRKQESANVFTERFAEALQGNKEAQQEVLSGLLSYAERNKLASSIPDTMQPPLIANQQLHQAPKHNRQEPTS